MKTKKWLKTGLITMIGKRVVGKLFVGSVLVWSSFEVDNLALEITSAVAGVWILISAVVTLYHGYKLIDALNSVEISD